MSSGERPSIEIQLLSEGTGEAKCPKGAMAKVHYTGMLMDGKVFDSSKGRGPLDFKVGAGQVIPCWDVGVQ